MNQPYRWGEHIVVTESEDESRRRLSAETRMEWSLQDPVHPFSRLQQAWMGKEDDDNEGGGWQQRQRGVFSLLSSGVIDQVTVSLASEASKDHPSGFWLHLRHSPPTHHSTTHPSSVLSKDELNGLITQWQDSRLITTPLQGSVWDRFTVRTSSSSSTSSSSHENNYQIFLPLTGVAWSADALKQSFQWLMEPCGSSGRGRQGPSSQPPPPPSRGFMGHSAMEWSKWLVEGSTTNKHMWMIWNTTTMTNVSSTTTMTTSPRQQDEPGSTTTRMEVRFGVSFDSFVELPTSLISRNETLSSCPLVTQRTVLVDTQPLKKKKKKKNDDVILPMATDTTVTATLKQVVRRPTPNEGRLETWFEMTSWWPPLSSCSFHLRQRIPYFFEPEWKSLQVLSSFQNDDNDNDDDKHHHENFHNSVEWDNEDDNDLGSVLTITHPLTPQSVLVSLEYQAAFLPIDDFPGNPNRGRELPPAVVTLSCRPTNPPQQQQQQQQQQQRTNNSPIIEGMEVHTFFSNSVLIVPPVPDMSMPFNVLSLSCSMYAYLIGTLMTLLIKRSSTRVRYRLHPDQRPPSMIQTLRTKLLLLLLRRHNLVVSPQSSPPPQEDSTTTGAAALTKDDDDDDPSEGLGVVGGVVTATSAEAATSAVAAEGNDESPSTSSSSR